MDSSEARTAPGPSGPAALPALPELKRRPLRPPSYLAESRALRVAVQALAQAPQSILQVIAEQTLEALDAGSAGISMLDEDGRSFLWPAIAGRWKPHVDMSMPRESSLCGDVLEAGGPLLVLRPELCYPDLAALRPSIVEALTVPFHVEGKAVGSLWAMLHEPKRAFDLEDLRLLESLAGFASAAQHTWSQLSRVDEARRAALNLTEDAIQARQVSESLNRELFESRRALADELADSKLLQEISAEIIHERDERGLYDKLLDTAMSLMRSDHACMHVLAPESAASEPAARPRLLAQRGSAPAGVEVLTRLIGVREGPFGSALRERTRVVIPDLERTETLRERERELCRAARMQACQSTPLVSRGGSVLGTLSTHWTDAHLPSDRDLRLLDILCRLTADLVERNVAEEALSEREAALNEAQRVAHVGNWTWTQATNQSVASDEFRRIFGLQPGEPVPEFKDQMERLYPARSWQRLQAALRSTLRTGVGFELDVEAQRKGETIWVTTRCEAIRDDEGAVVGLRGTVQDITERKQLEMELARKVEELAAQDRAKNDFLAMLSHELRNPLNAIRGWVALLQRPDLKPENVRQGISVIDRQSRAQAELIGDLLDVQRLNSGKVRLETAPVDLANVVHAAVEAIVPSATEKGIRVCRVLPEGETKVLGDANRLQQVIWNLLSNSLKFTPARGEIRIELRSVGAQAEIRLNDTGEGITTEALPHIFERFRQADASSSRIHGGLGLGLAIARQLVELHGGRIHAESPGKGLGATFVVTLPLHSEVEALRRRPLAEQSGAGAPRSLQGRVVLVVDDEVDAREPLRQVLESVGAEVIAVGSVDEALAVVERQRPEIIVSDIAMPARDGYELVRSVRSLPGERGGRTPLVALTAFASEADRERALGAGFSAHLGKPVEAARLVQVITSLVSLPVP